MREVNLNTGIPTAGVPVTDGQPTTNMSNQYFYDSPVNYQQQGYYQQSNPYIQQNTYNYNPYQQSQANFVPMSGYGQQYYPNAPQMQYLQYGQYYQQPMYQNPYQFQQEQPMRGFFDIPQTNDFLRDGNVQQFIKEHGLDLSNPSHFSLAKQYARDIGVVINEQPHQHGVKTWEFMRNPNPAMMPNNPYMDPRNGYMGVGGIGYNSPNIAAMPYNGGQPMMYQQGYSIPQMQYVPDRVVHVDGFKMPGSQFMIPADIEQRISKLQGEMIAEIEEEKVKRARKAKGQFNANPYSFYGYNTYSWEFQQIINKYYKKIDELVEECRSRRTDFNKRLVKMCRHYANDDISDEELDKMFSGYDYKIPGSQLQMMSEFEYVADMVPVDHTCNPYYMHALERRRLFEQVYGPDVPGNNRFMTNTSAIEDYYQLEESRRKRLSYGSNGMFNTDQYLHQFRRNIEARLAADSEYVGYGSENSRDKINIFNQELYSSPTDISKNFKEAPKPNDVYGVPPEPTGLKSPAELTEPENKNYMKVMQNKDGSLELSPPDWIVKSVLGEEAFAKQQLEDSYNERKVAFYQALHSDGGD